MALVNPGDEVLIPSPYWVSYPEQVRLLGGVPVPVATQESTGFDLDPAALRARGDAADQADRPQQPRQSDRRGVLAGGAGRGGASSPSSAISGSSPTSATRRSPTRAGTCRSPRSRPEIKARTIVVNTCSKAYAMTGLAHRLRGRAPRPIIKAMTDVQSQVTSNPTSIAQWAAVEALDRPAGRGRQDGGRVRPAPPRHRRRRSTRSPA